ncbi:FtsX-like permease family protein [Kitasatospora sp. NPDC054939]
MLGFVVRRLRGRPALAGAVLLTMLITTTVLTALVAFDGGVAAAGLGRALQGSGHPRTTVLVTAEHAVAARAADDAAVREYGTALFGTRPVRTDTLARSRSYGLPAAGPATATAGRNADLTVLASLDPGRVGLLAGTLPGKAQAAAPHGPVQAAAPSALLTRLGLTPDALPAEVRLDDRYGGAPLTVRITGAYRASDPDQLYWRLDPAGGREIHVGDFATYGPLLVDDTAFTTAGIVQDDRAWLLDADLSGIRAAEAAALRDRATGLAADLRKRTGLQTATELPALLRELDAGALVARSTLLIGALQLVSLAGAVLLLVVRLMAARQEGENALLTARGAAPGRLAALTAAECLLLALPAALLAPLLSPLLLRALATHPALVRLPLDTRPDWTLWPVATACALACVLLTTGAAVLRGAGAAVLRRSAGRRQAVVGTAVRSGTDLAVLGLAVLAYRQLAQYEGGLSADADGELGLDPVLIAAPTLALAAGTLLVLRLLPLAARLGGHLAARGRGLVPALAGWQLARRPARAGGPVLLLVLAVATGVLALGQHHSWSASQRDQADFATAGGLRIDSGQAAALGQGGRYGALPGGDRLLPVIRQQHTLPDGVAGQVLVLDTRGLAERVPVRPDLLDGQDPRALFAPLGQPAPAGPQNGVPLPGTPQRIDLDLTVTPDPGSSAPPDLWVLLRDRHGITVRIPVPGLPERGNAVVRADLAAPSDAPVGSPAGPLTLAGIVAAHGGTFRPPASGDLTIRGLAAADTADGPATAVPVPAGLAWAGVSYPGEHGSRSTVLPPTAGEQNLLRLHYAFSGEVSTQVNLAPAGAFVPDKLTGVATRGYLRALGASVGDTVRVPFAGLLLPVEVRGAVGSLPVAGDTAFALDLATAGHLLATGGRQLPAPTEWWLPATGPDDPVPARAAAALRATPDGQGLRLNGELAALLSSDPVGAAPQSALAALAVAGTLLAAIGFAASAAASARERAGEFTVLLALGTPRRQLVRTAAAEQAAVVTLAGAVGLALGTVIVHLVVPLVVLTPTAARPVPEVAVGLPLGPTLLLTAAIAAVPLLSALLTGRRRDVAARLRHVEEM